MHTHALIHTHAKHTYVLCAFMHYHRYYYTPPPRGKGSITPHLQEGRVLSHPTSKREGFYHTPPPRGKGTITPHLQEGRVLLHPTSKREGYYHTPPPTGKGSITPHHLEIQFGTFFAPYCGVQEIVGGGIIAAFLENYHLVCSVY